jgi:hypothetical protein
MISKLLRCLTVIVVVSLAGLGACAESPDPEPDRSAEPADIGLGVEGSMLGPIDDPTDDNCCPFGYWRCKTTGEHFGYDALSCFAGTSSVTAQRECDRACTGDCINSGWIDPCP